MKSQLILASNSPRRAELLQQLGLRFEVLRVDVDEVPAPGQSPADYARAIALAKAQAGAAQIGTTPSLPVLGADTAVVLDGRILTKPVDADDGERMLRALSGRVHTVLTAIALATDRGVATRLSRSEVTFRQIAAAEARAYWATGEPCDKAGGYAVQGRGAVFVAALTGSFSGVMGLPLFETAQLLDVAGVPRWRSG